MNTAREGGSTVQIGSYIVTLGKSTSPFSTVYTVIAYIELKLLSAWLPCAGGVSPQGYPIPSMEVLDPRRATAGWQPVPNWSFPGAAKDQCTVATRYLSDRRPNAPSPTGTLTNAISPNRQLFDQVKAGKVQ
jgi:hypothetical protein